VPANIVDFNNQRIWVAITHESDDKWLSSVIPRHVLITEAGVPVSLDSGRAEKSVSLLCLPRPPLSHRLKVLHAVEPAQQQPPRANVRNRLIVGMISPLELMFTETGDHR